MEKSLRTVCLPLREQEDRTLEIGVNGKMYLLRRGEAAQVEEAVWEVLKNAGLLGGEER